MASVDSKPGRGSPPSRISRALRRVTAAAIVLAVAGATVVLGVERWLEHLPRDTESVRGDGERGALIVRMAGCVTCHTGSEDGSPLLAGGLEIETPFGTFFPPNITPDPMTGIGGWSLATFDRALVRGIGPDGRHYYPTFPYTSYTRMTMQDVADLKAFLDTVPAVRARVPRHDVPFPLSVRWGLALWKLLFFEPGEIEARADRSDAWNRGRYLVNGPGHCGECHTERNILGAVSGTPLAGAAVGPDGDAVPGIRAGAGDPLGDWTLDDIVFTLETGIKPDGDTLGSRMADVVDDSTGHLSAEDLAAIATYLKQPDS